MTDQEAIDLLLTLGAKRVKDWQQEPNHQIPADAPRGIEGDILGLLWFVGMKPSQDDLLSAGATREQIAKAYEYHKSTMEIVEPSDLVPIPPDLLAKIRDDLTTALDQQPTAGPQRIDEKWIREIEEYRVEMYHNEGKHRGRPHVVVNLQDGKVSISLDDPPEILTPTGYRGEANALKVIAKHCVLLRQIWDSSRPDDQRLPPRPAAAT